MISIVHVVAADFEPGLWPGLRALLERLPREQFAQRVVYVAFHLDAIDASLGWRVGGSAGTDAAAIAHLSRQLGWRVEAAPRPIASLDPAGFRALRPFLAAGRDTLVHAWTPIAQAACRRGSAAGNVLTLSRVPIAAAALRVLQQSLTDGTIIAAGSQVLRRHAAQRGIDPRRVVVVRQPVDFKAVNAARARRMRDSLIPPTDGPLILVAGPIARDGGGLNGVWSTAMLQQVHRRTRVMVPFLTPHGVRAQRFLSEAKLGWMFVDPPADWSWPELLSVADIFLEPNPEVCPTEPIAWAMASGVPVAGVAIRSVAELISSRQNGLLSKTNDVTALANSMLTLMDDPVLRRQLTETARGQAFEVFSTREFVDNMTRLYDNLRAGRAPDDGIRDTAMVGA